MWRKIQNQGSCLLHCSNSNSLTPQGWGLSSTRLPLLPTPALNPRCPTPPSPLPGSVQIGEFPWPPFRFDNFLEQLTKLRKELHHYSLGPGEWGGTASVPSAGRPPSQNINVFAHLDALWTSVFQSFYQDFITEAWMVNSRSCDGTQSIAPSTWMEIGGMVLKVQLSNHLWSFLLNSP